METETEFKRQVRQTDYVCPKCNSKLVSIQGDSVNPRNGFTVYCPASANKCLIEPVNGHGKTEERAYSIIMAKFSDGLIETETVDEEPKEIKEVIVKEITMGPETPIKTENRGRGRPPKIKSVVVEEDLPL